MTSDLLGEADPAVPREICCIPIDCIRSPLARITDSIVTALLLEFGYVSRSSSRRVTSIRSWLEFLHIRTGQSYSILVLDS